MPTNTIPVEQLDAAGLILDIPAVNLPPNAFSDGRNVRFKDGAIRKMLGEEEVFMGIREAVGGVNLVHFEYWANPNGPTYIAISEDGHIWTVTVDLDGNAVGAKRSVNEDGSDNPMTNNGDARWQVINFNGGYSIIINNGLETPRHITDGQGVDSATLRTEDLPGWDSYMAPDSEGNDTEVTLVTAANIIAVGNLLLAGDLSEFDTNGEIVRDLRGVVRSSDVAEPGAIPQNWNPFQDAVNTADEIIIADTGQITAMVQLQGNIYVYTADSINQLRIQSDGLAQSPVTSNYGALGRDAVLEFDGSHVVVGSNDMYVFSGHPGSIQSISDGRVRQSFYERTHYLYISDLRIVRNQRFDELWFCYATSGSATGLYNEALIWNYKNNTWTIRDLPEARIVTIGPLPGGGISAVVFDVGGDANNEGQVFTMLDIGTQEVQTLEITGSAQAAHAGVFQVQEATFPDPSPALEVEAGETIHVTITGNVEPDLEFSTWDLTFPSFTPNKNSSVAGGTRLSLTGTNPASVTIDASILTFTDGDRDGYVAAIATAINDDAALGLEDYTASASGGTLRLVSDVMGERTINSASLTTYVGDVEQISGSTQTVTEGLTFSVQSNPASSTYAAFDSGTVTSGGAGGITASVTSTPGSTSIGGLTTSAFSGNGIVNISDLSYVYARSEGRGNHTILQYPQPDGGGHPTQIFSYSQDDNPGFTVTYRGPAYQSGDGSPTVSSSASAVSGNGSLAWSGFTTPAEIGRRTVTVTPTTYTVRFTNTNNYIVTLNSDTSGGARTLNPGEQSPEISLGANNQYRIASNGGTQEILAFDSGTITSNGSAGGVTSSVVSGTPIPGGLSTITWSGGGQGGVGYQCVQSDDGHTLFCSLTITANTVMAQVQLTTGRGYVRGPAWQSGDSVASGPFSVSAADLAAASQVSAGSSVFVAALPSNGASLVSSGTGRIERTADVPTFNISYTNTNSYPVTLNGNATPYANRSIAANGQLTDATGLTSNSHRISANQQALNLGTVTWTVQNDRTSAVYPLQEDVVGLTVSHGGASTAIGEVPAGTTQMATSAGGATATTGTWTGNIFSIETASFPGTDDPTSSTNNAASTSVGPITIDRTTNTRVAADNGSGTSSSDNGIVDVDVTPTGTAFMTDENERVFRATRFPSSSTITTPEDYGYSHAGDDFLVSSFVVDSALDGGNGGNASIQGTVNGNNGTWIVWGGPTTAFTPNHRNTLDWEYFRLAGTNTIIQLPQVFEDLGFISTNHFSSDGDSTTGPNFSLTVQHGTQSDTYSFTMTNDSGFPLPNFNSNLGGVTAGGTLAAGASRTATDRTSNSWSYNHGAALDYTYNARTDTDQGDATLSVAGGSQNVTLTGTNQLVGSNLAATVGISGTYQVVSGTSTPQTAPGFSLIGQGNGEYGFANDTAPNASFEVTYSSGGDSFDIIFPAFPQNGTSAEYAEFIATEAQNYPELSGLDPEIASVVQPDDAIFYVTNVGDEVQFTHLEVGESGPGSETFELHTVHEGIVYEADHFGADVSETISATVPGQTGVAPPVVGVTHAAIGEDTVVHVLTGTYTTGEDLAARLAPVINAQDGFTASHTGAVITATRTESDSGQGLPGDTDIVLSYLDNDPGYALASFATTVPSEEAEAVPPTLTVTAPSGDTDVLDGMQPLQQFTVSLEEFVPPNPGERLTITPEEIAGAIRDQAPDLYRWDISGTGRDVIFTAYQDPALESSNDMGRHERNGFLPTPFFDPALIPGYNTGDILGRSVEGTWNLMTDFGNTQTVEVEGTPLMSSQDAVETTPGSYPTYQVDAAIQVPFNAVGDGSGRDPLTLDVGTMNPEAIANLLHNSLDDFSDLESNLEETPDRDTDYRITVFALDLTADGRNILLPIRRQGNIGISGTDPDIIVDAAEIGSGNTGTDDERPWRLSVINDTQNYPVMATATQVFGGDLGYDFGGTAYTSYVERQHFHMTPTKDTEMLHEVHLHAEGDVQQLFVPITVSNVLNEDVNLTDFSMTDRNKGYTYDFNVRAIPMDYKVDVRQHGRFFNMRISDEGLTQNSTDSWDVATYALEVGKGGER